MAPSRRSSLPVAFLGDALRIALTIAVPLWAPAHSRAAEHPPVPGSASMTSEQCVECHNGNVALAVRTRDARAGFVLAADDSAIARERRSGHPTGVDYDQAQARPGSRLRPPAALDPAIRLEDGKVGCPTCHDLRSSRSASLVTPARGGLCAGCHDL